MLDECSLEVFFSEQHESDAELELNLVLRGVHVSGAPGAPSPVHMAHLARHWQVDDDRCATDPSIGGSMQCADRLHHTVLVTLHSRVLAVAFLSKAPLHVDFLKEPAGGADEKLKLPSAGKNLRMPNEGRREVQAKNFKVELPPCVILKIVGIHLVRKHEGGIPLACSRSGHMDRSCASCESSNFSIKVAGVGMARPRTPVGSCRFAALRRHGKVVFEIVFETLKLFFVDKIFNDFLFAFRVLRLVLSWIKVFVSAQIFLVRRLKRFSGLCGRSGCQNKCEYSTNQP